MHEHVDILLATYNGEEFISEQIESILDQTHQHFTLLIGDDASQDTTAELVTQYEKKTPDKIKLFSFKQNVGAILNFSRLCSLAKSPYMMLSDQDDIWLPAKIEMTLAKMKEMETIHGPDTPLLVHTDLCVVDENLKVLHPSFWSYSKNHPKNNCLPRVLIQNNVTGSTIMFNKALQKLAFPIPNRVYMHEHWINIVATVFGNVGWISEKTIYYRQHSTNTFGAYKRSDMRQKFSLSLDRKNLVRSNKILKAKILQTGIFYKKFSVHLDKKTQEIFENFITIKNKPFFEEIKTRFRYNFHRGGFYIGIYDLIASYLIGRDTQKNKINT